MGGLSPLFEHGVGELLLLDRPEFSVYVVMKLQVYQRIHELGQRDPGNIESTGLLGGISARRIHATISKSGRDPVQQRRRFTDLIDVSSYFVGWRMQKLNHGTILIESGRGRRGATQYRWNEPVSPNTLDNYRTLVRLLGRNVSFGVDLYRIVDSFGTDPFHVNELIELYREHRSKFVERKWYGVSTRILSQSPELTQFLVQRVEDLERFGFLKFDEGRDRVCVTSEGHQVATAFELFAYSVHHRGAAGTAQSVEDGSPAAS